MEYNSEAESCSQNDSLLSITSSSRYREDTISPEEQSLLQHLQRGILETTEENIAYTKEILPLLSKLNLEPQSLPNDLKEGLQKVALTLRFEKLSDVDDVTMSIARKRKNIEEKKRQREEKELSLLYNDLFKKYTAFSNKLNELQGGVDSIEGIMKDLKEEQEDIYCTTVAVSLKLKEYEQAVGKLETDLADMQVHDLYPQKILNKYDKYLEMSVELAELNQFLSSYGDLPPNLLQGKALLKAKQKEYETLEKEFLEKTSYS